MITPDQIRQKAERLYPRLIQAWLKNQEFFPRDLPSSKQLSGDISRDIESVQALRNGSKAERGVGYSVEWTERRLHMSGRNEVPTRILFETRDDLLQLIGRMEEFAAFQSAVAKIRQRLPQLESWLCSHVKSLVSVIDAVDGLITVTEWFREHPLPHCFAREIPVNVDTKFVERHRKVLQQWFDEAGVLPVHGVRSHESDFYRRYGLRDKEPFILTRFLDAAVQQKLGFPCEEVSIPLSSFATMNVQDVRVFVVENEISARTFPRSSNSMVIFGMGNAAVNLRDLKWLQKNDVIYWGDLDVYGLRILANFRQLVAPARSLLMDMNTLRRFRNPDHRVQYSHMEVPVGLEPAEQAAFLQCRDQNQQLEQEHIPHSEVCRAVEALTDRPVTRPSP